MKANQVPQMFAVVLQPHGRNH